MGYCGYQEELLHHHKCPTTSYSITVCSVLRCTGGFVIALIPNGKGVRMMLSTKYRESIERRFHAFCKAVLHNEACNYYRERKRRTQCEISFEYLQENTSFAPHSVDEYFALQDKSTAFAVNGQTVIIDSEKLAKALLCLSERRREIILMRYYLQLRDKQIGALLGKPRTTVNYQKNAALKQLRTEMEKMNDEEQQIQPCSL